MKLNQIRIVLVETSHPGNIGAAARAMKTMGLSQLYLVNPKSFPDAKATELASKADDILEQAVCTDTLEQALAGVRCVFMTSARSREIAIPVVTPEEAAKKALALPDDAEVAMVFGRERTGLYNEELLKGQFHIEIPTNPNYSSLNLSQAVQIVAYELAKHSESIQPSIDAEADELATADALEGFYQQLQEVLADIDFLKPSNPKQVIFKLKRLFNRAMLEAKEVNILRGILTQVSRSISK